MKVVLLLFLLSRFSGVSSSNPIGDYGGDRRMKGLISGVSGPVGHKLSALKSGDSSEILSSSSSFMSRLDTLSASSTFSSSSPSSK